MSAPEVKDNEENHFFIPYDEWNFKKRAYLKNHCRLFPRSAATSDFNYYQSALREHAFLYTRMRKMLNNFRNKRAVQRRQAEGNEFDLDATVDHYTDIRSHATPSDKVYLSNLKRENDVSILVLIDGSLSSDGYSDGNRIIDVEKKAALLFGEVLNENCVDFSMASFYSKTRSYSVFTQLKEFDAPWKSCAGKVAAIDPCGFTRIGVALRHAGELLSKRDSRKKWLLLLSDGKPNDFDTYEGRYGINDVRQALRELKQKQVETFAFAIEKSAKTYLPQLFGTGNYQVMPSLTELIGAMSVFYERVRK
jgi:nitric oxide reductase NorD protein